MLFMDLKNSCIEEYFSQILLVAPIWLPIIANFHVPLFSPYDPLWHPMVYYDPYHHRSWMTLYYHIWALYVASMTLYAFIWPPFEPILVTSSKGAQSNRRKNTQIVWCKMILTQIPKHILFDCARRIFLVFLLFVEVQPFPLYYNSMQHISTISGCRPLGLGSLD